MAQSPIIEVAGLVKAYGEHRAVDDVTFSVAEGEVLAVLGPNGAGKTSTVEILEGHRQATSGRVKVLGTDPARAEPAFRDRIGIVLQETGIEPQLSVREAISVYGSVYSKRRDTDELLELVGLVDESELRFRQLSGGQQRRLDLALGLVGDPDLLFLDEPTTGFDPAARRQSWSLIEGLTGLGKTVLLTTHYLDEAQRLADRVIVMSSGSIVAEGSPDQLLARSSQLTRISFTLPQGDGAVDDLFGGVDGEVRGRNGRVEIHTARPTADLAQVCGWAAERSIELGGLEVARPSLEDVYLDLVGELGDDNDEPVVP
ncbi:MAG: ABC transporter ATP-binding protein [Acidimicrobiales bacterium]